MKKKDKYDSNWAEKLILKKTKELINKEPEEKEFQDGNYYNLSDIEFKKISMLGYKSSIKMQMLMDLLKQTNDTQERLRITDTYEALVSVYWNKFYEMFPNLNDYQVLLELQDKRIKIVRKKLDWEI